MNSIRLVSMTFGFVGGALLCLLADATSLPAQDGKSKELGGLNENKFVAIYLGKSPEMSFLLWSGHAVVVAQVTLQPTDKSDMFKAKIVSLNRLSYDDSTRKYTQRVSPQIKKVPFDCENGLTYTFLDGSKWALGDDFTISKTNLRQRVEAIPEFGPDNRYPLQIPGWTLIEKLLEKLP